MNLKTKLKLVLFFIAISISKFTILADGSDYAKPWDVSDSESSPGTELIILIIIIVIAIVVAKIKKNKNE